MAMKSVTSLLFAGISLAALLAACGPEPAPQTPVGATPEGSGPAPSSSAAAQGQGAPASVGTAQPPGAPLEMKDASSSTMAGDLQDMGLDLKNLPPLEKLEPNKLRKVMRTFTKSLGAKCSDCHNESDYAAMTPMKKITLHMWNDYVRGLAFEDGTALYCDSCHQGKMKFLDRHDKKALGAWMDQNFVRKEKRRDGKEHGCETCHGDPFEPSILAKWTK